MNHYRGRKIWGRHVTRKDFYHTYDGTSSSYYPKKHWRKNANRAFRKYKGDVQDGNWYRKVFEVWWNVF